jgi:hypothetical protein
MGKGEGIRIGERNRREEGSEFSKRLILYLLSDCKSISN